MYILKKNAVLNIFILIFIMGFFLNHSFAIDIYYKDKPVKTTVSPIIKDGNILIPIAEIAKVLGSEVKWNKDEKMITINSPLSQIELVIGSKQIGYTSFERQLCVGGNCDNKFEKVYKNAKYPVILIENRAMASIDVLSMIIDCSISINKDTNSILINSKVPKTEKSKNIDSLIINVLKNTKEIKKKIKNINDIVISENPKDINYYQNLANFNEFLPGKYKSYSVYLNEHDHIRIYLDINENKVYLFLDYDIYKLPEYEKILSFEYIKKEQLPSKYKNLKPLTEYKKISINEKNAVKETVNILKKLKILDENQKYYIKSVLPSYDGQNIDEIKTNDNDDTLNLNKIDGYYITIHLNENAQNLSDILGKYYINSDGTSIMEYDETDQNYHIYGYFYDEEQYRKRLYQD